MLSKDERASIAITNGKKQLGKVPHNAKLKPGLVVGNLTLLYRIDPVGSKNKKSIHWQCQCNCENRTLLVKTSNHLLRKDCRLHCGCIPSKRPANFKGYEEISGSWFYRVKRNAHLRNLDFCISIQDVWDIYLAQSKQCALSGIVLSFEDHTENIASLDRVDSSKGYIKNNVQLVHKDINRIKLDFDQTYFISLCTRIANKFPLSME